MRHWNPSFWCHRQKYRLRAQLPLQPTRQKRGDLAMQLRSKPIPMYQTHPAGQVRGNGIPLPTSGMRDRSSGRENRETAARVNFESCRRWSGYGGAPHHNQAPDMLTYRAVTTAHNSSRRVPVTKLSCTNPTNSDKISARTSVRFALAGLDQECPAELSSGGSAHGHGSRCHVAVAACRLAQALG
jgi:hypothetical protein